MTAEILPSFVRSLSSFVAFVRSFLRCLRSFVRRSFVVRSFVRRWPLATFLTLRRGEEVESTAWKERSDVVEWALSGVEWR